MLSEQIPAGRVEKSGTGIVQAKAGDEACKAGLSLTMDSVERVVSRKHAVIQSFKFYCIEDLRSRKPSVH